MTHRTPPDEILYLNVKYIYLALFFLPFAMAILWAFAPYDPVLPPLMTWVFGVAAVTALQLWKPFYPFYTSEVFAPARVLTEERGRVLSFLKGREAKRLPLCVGLVATALIVLAVVVGRLAPVQWSLIEGYPSWSLQRRSAAAVLWGLGAAVLTALTLLFGNLSVSAWHVRRTWDRIQSLYQPWPLRNLRRDFTYIAKRRLVTVHAYSPPGAEERGDLWAKPLGWREAVAVPCFIFGASALYFGTIEMVPVISEPERHPSGAALRMVLVPAAGLLLLVIGRWVWRRH
jgi:hypothetical protein